MLKGQLWRTMAAKKWRKYHFSNFVIKLFPFKKIGFTLPKVLTSRNGPIGKNPREFWDTSKHVWGITISKLGWQIYLE